VSSGKKAKTPMTSLCSLNFVIVVWKLTSVSQCRMEKNLLPQVYKGTVCPENIRSQICNSLSNPSGNKESLFFFKKKSIRYKANYSKYKWAGGKEGDSDNMCMPPKYQEESLVRF